MHHMGLNHCLYNTNCMYCQQTTSNHSRDSMEVSCEVANRTANIMSKRDVMDNIFEFSDPKTNTNLGLIPTHTTVRGKPGHTLALSFPLVTPSPRSCE
ncbi:Protein of unknown function [Gryllus bimaculatus]|nr:Protein of unknown function [Gryllus bimaculatus]